MNLIQFSKINQQYSRVTSVLPRSITLLLRTQQVFIFYLFIYSDDCIFSEEIANPPASEIYLLVC